MARRSDHLESLLAAALTATITAGTVVPPPTLPGPRLSSSEVLRAGVSVLVDAASAAAGAAPHRGHGHPLHAFGSRALANTSGDTIGYTVVVADPTEYVKDAASDKIITEALEFAAKQPFYFPSRVQR